MSRAGFWALIPLTALSMPRFLFGAWGLINNSSCQGWGHCESKGASEAMDSGWQPFLQVEGTTGRRSCRWEEVPVTLGLRLMTPGAHGSLQASAELKSEKDTDAGSLYKSSMMPTKHAKVRGRGQ